MNTISIVFPVLNLIRRSLSSVEVNSPLTARLFCKIIPAQCPFKREIKIGDRTIISIPPLCHFNPFYEQLIALRFKSLTYLADECGEDITLYC